MNIQRSMLACAAALAASMSAAYAGPCSPEITGVQDLIDARTHAKAGAEIEVGQTSPEEFTAITAAMTRAVEADAAGDLGTCEQALAEAKRLLGLIGTQTDNTGR